MVVEQDFEADDKSEAESSNAETCDEENLDNNILREEEDDEDKKPIKKKKTEQKIEVVKDQKIKNKKIDHGPLCHICLQKTKDPDLRLYFGHPNNALEEYLVLLDPRLCLFNGDETDVSEGDIRALNKITLYR